MEVDPSSAMIASLAAASLFLSCETALAGEVVQGGVFESLGYDPSTATKVNLIIQIWYDLVYSQESNFRRRL